MWFCLEVWLLLTYGVMYVRSCVVFCFRRGLRDIIVVQYMYACTHPVLKLHYTFFVCICLVYLVLCLNYVRILIENVECCVCIVLFA